MRSAPSSASAAAIPRALEVASARAFALFLLRAPLVGVLGAGYGAGLLAGVLLAMVLVAALCALASWAQAPSSQRGGIRRSDCATLDRPLFSQGKRWSLEDCFGGRCQSPARRVLEGGG